MSKKTKGLINLGLIAALYAALYAAEKCLGSSAMMVTVLRKGTVYALLAVSMNMLNGFTGLFSLGQAGFMLVGAYAYAILTIPVAKRLAVYQYYGGGLVQFTVPVLVGILAGGLVAAIFAALIGLPVLRLKSDYLAIATLGFAEIIRAVVQYKGLGALTNGSNLLKTYPTFATLHTMGPKNAPAFIKGLYEVYATLFPYLVCGACILVIVLMLNSTYGRAFKAIRDDEIAAEAMGISLFRHKQISFVVSSFFAGIGGALLAMFQQSLQANAFKSSMTYEILLIVVIGGLGSISGSVLASYLFIACSEWWLRFLDNEQFIFGWKVPLLRSGFRMVVFSVIIMAIVLFFRKGIMGDKELDLVSMFTGKSRKERKMQ
ncbi:MAG: branched-chain amino acid ABC transporter permease [Eubacteriales bacterium]|nr:branched-chain amino acid ABC transporter permease [Eubacteriales bacterium]